MSAHYTVEPPATDSEWRAFFSDGRQRLEQTRDSYEAWVGLLDAYVAAHGRSAQTQDIQAYADAVGAWIGAQEEQSTLSEACYEVLSVDQQQGTDCYEGILSARGAEWQAAADRVNAFLTGG